MDTSLMLTPSEGDLCFDNTKLSCYKENPRKYYLRHVRGWTRVSDRKPLPLAFGEAWHSAMDAVWAPGPWDSTQHLIDAGMENFYIAWEGCGYSRQPRLDEMKEWGNRNPGVAHEMLYNYVVTRERMIREGTTLAIEKPIAMPIPGMDGVWYIGRLDKVVEYNGVHILEHKTTSMYSIEGTFRSDYIESWGSAPQIKGYQVVGSMYFPDLQDVWVDCALVHKSRHDGFKFVPIAHSWPLLEAWIRDTKSWIERIQSDMANLQEHGDLKHGAFPDNEDSHFGKYGKDSFLDVYNAFGDPSELQEPPPGFVVDRWEPFDTFNLKNLSKEEVA